jgi:hypothetical protein
MVDASIDRYIRPSELAYWQLIHRRQHVVSKFDIVRSRLIDNETTPLQVGNGNFAYNVDSTGMQVRGVNDLMYFEDILTERR